MAYHLDGDLRKRFRPKAAAEVRPPGAAGERAMRCAGGSAGELLVQQRASLRLRGLVRIRGVRRVDRRDGGFRPQD